jgi:cytochrome c-type biogenesis protein CcmE
MGFLFVVAVQRSGGVAYYLTVSEFLDQPGRAMAGVRINGKVVPGSIDRLPGGTEVRFTMSDGQRVLPVHFRGIIPDTFVDEADVVVEGQLGGDGRFAADTLLAKCPSKYEAADEAPPPAPGSSV